MNMMKKAMLTIIITMIAVAITAIIVNDSIAVIRAIAGKATAHTQVLSEILDTVALTVLYWTWATASPKSGAGIMDFVCAGVVRPHFF